ncbi:hypothetical protein [Bacillus cereus group sp. BfR-BA-01380]|uniref:hypothetical protein n=1 Tax=Bacillus cereus group sp. BfR-BA-01380 TaxID=2920324 RepID=UPI001F55B51F|nr:hypothetical protein [Bacillus cereus group sp. BfR-BA-01380]
MNGLCNQLCILKPGNEVDFLLRGASRTTTLTFINFDPENGCITGKDCNGAIRTLSCHCICAFSPRIPRKELCCKIIVEHKTQLVPPAKRGTASATKTVVANIEKVCPEVVVICGVIHKTITYTAVIDGCEVENHVIKDDVPFQCLIEQNDIKEGDDQCGITQQDGIKEGDQFRIIQQGILCEVFAHEANFGGQDHSVAFKFVEKDIVKVCIEKVRSTNY